ncbi:MAG: tyrosine--tRNA ligase, partial [Clostridia bacterium]
NKMLTAECFKQRLEKGLSFLEFNYMLMQSYDFLMLYKKYGCSLQLGGDDQWSNILSGADLIRRKEGQPAYAMTFALLTTSEGKKMGKTAKGAVWLDPNKTSPYDFYQYWRNVEDSNVENCLKILTFLPLEEIAELVKYKDERINQAKIKLAYEVTKLIHGEQTANEVQSQVVAAFSGDTDSMQEVNVTATDSVIDILLSCNLAKSKGDARRLIEGGGVSVDDTKIVKWDDKLQPNILSNGSFVLHKGKKVHIKVNLIK